MDTEILSQLLARCESDLLDFKLLPYDLGAQSDDPKTKERKRANFAKDMLAFANIWRDQPRHIVIGAKRHLDGTMQAPGILRHVDGADLVQALDGLVHPCPRFHYAQVEFNGLHYGVIEISGRVRRLALLPPPPLRTVRATFTAHGSSTDKPRFTGAGRD